MPIHTIGVRFGAAISANEPRTVLAMTLSGAGLTVLPRFLFEPHLTTGALVVVLPDHRVEPAPIAAVLPGPSSRNPRTELFLSFLVPRVRARLLRHGDARRNEPA